MTSKNLSFKLMTEDMKRRIWLISLLALSFFFGVIVPMMFTISMSAEDFENTAQMLSYAQRGARRLLECEHGMGSVILIIASAVCSTSGFSYLYSGKKTDLYHSIPVKRRELFLAHFTNGILMPGVCFLVSQITAACMAATVGVSFGEGISLALKAWSFHMSYYVLMYATMVAAVMMTGNLLISLLGGLVFNVYVPMMGLLFNGYFSMFFFTYRSTGEEFWNTMINKGSPWVYYIYQSEHVSLKEKGWFVSAAAVLAVSALLAVISWWLYEKRPSEVAGKAMAFRVSQTPIRILLVIPVSLFFGLLFIALRDTLGWGIFGLICGGVLTHCLIEIIYHFDFRKLFSKKLHMVLCTAVSLVIFCGFRFDWFGYDTYLPSAEEVEYASVSLGNVDDWVSYGTVKQMEYDDGTIAYLWRYGDVLDYAGEHMKITNLEPVLSLAETCIQNQEYGSYRFQIQYHLKNGRTVMRNYYTNFTGVEEDMEKIFDLQEYKKGIYPLLLQTPEETMGIRLKQYDQMQEMLVNDAEREELLQTYQEELLSLTAERAKQELPIAAIQFVTRDMAEVFSSPYRDYDDIENRHYYPVYPSFHKTLELLKKAGAEVLVQSAETVDEIQVEVFPKDSVNSTSSMKIYTNPEQIKELLPALIPDDYYGMNPFYEAEILEYTDAYVWVKDADGRKQIHCELDASKIPDFLK